MSRSISPARPPAQRRKASGHSRPGFPVSNVLWRVLAAKGGGGKRSSPENQAAGVGHLGAKVGLLDCDIYGPSIPLMMGLHQKPTINDQEKMVPPANYGVKLMSMGLLLEGDQPVIWRGPMIMKTIQQFFSAVEWGELD